MRFVTIFRATQARPSQPTRHTSLATSVALCCVFSFALSCIGAHGQTPTTDDVDVVVRTDLITVPFVVTGAHGARVSGLAATDFQARIDGQPVPVSYFAAGTTRVALLFALDTSGSLREQIARQRATALALFEHFGRNSNVAVLTFDESAQLKLPFTNALEQARAAFQFDARPNRHTAIFDAALQAVQAFDVCTADCLERRIVVLISDGLDTASTVRPADVIAAANARGVTFYVIHLPLYTPAAGDLVVRRPAHGFRDLGERTGGKYFLVGNEHAAYDPRASVDLAPVFETIAADLQSQYVLGLYAPPAARTGPHRVDINLNAPAGRKLRVQQLRAGYNLRP